MTTVIAFIIVLGFLVFVHELGHFGAAKMVGVEVKEFSIGFPPKITSKVFRGTEYIISWIPLGGYVRLKGQNIDDENPDEEDNYAAKSFSQRFFILIAGAIMNLLVALILAPLVLYIGQDVPVFYFDPPIINSVAADSNARLAGFKGQDRIVAVNGQAVNNWQETYKALGAIQSKSIQLIILREEQRITISFGKELLGGKGGFGWSIHIKPVIGSVVSGSPADKAGLRSDDYIVQINQFKITDWTEITSAISKSNGQEVVIEYIRDGQKQSAALIPYRNSQDNRWIIGVGSKTVKVSEGFTDSIVNGVGWVGQLTKSTLGFLYKLITGGTSSKSIGGPIMIAQMVGQAAERGISELLQLVGFISLQLCVFNLLPIPALDGGHIFFLIIEKIKGSTLSKGFRLGAQKIGFIILMALITLVLIQDGFRVFTNI